jgi:hypothetical protein
MARTVLFMSSKPNISDMCTARNGALISEEKRWPGCGIWESAELCAAFSMLIVTDISFVNDGDLIQIQGFM